MRGGDNRTGELFSYVDLEARVRRDHPLRAIRTMVNEALEHEFAGLYSPIVAAWDHSVFSKNRDRLLEGDIAAKFLAAVLAQSGVKRLLSSDHFSVDGTLIEAWASMKSVKPKDGSGV